MAEATETAEVAEVTDEAATEAEGLVTGPAVVEAAEAVVATARSDTHHLSQP